MQNSKKDLKDLEDLEGKKSEKIEAYLAKNPKDAEFLAKLSTMTESQKAIETVAPRIGKSIKNGTSVDDGEITNLSANIDTLAKSIADKEQRNKVIVEAVKPMTEGVDKKTATDTLTKIKNTLVDSDAKAAIDEAIKKVTPSPTP